MSDQKCVKVEPGSENISTDNNYEYVKNNIGLKQEELIIEDNNFLEEENIESRTTMMPVEFIKVEPDLETMSTVTTFEGMTKDVKLKQEELIIEDNDFLGREDSRLKSEECLKLPEPQLEPMHSVFITEGVVEKNAIGQNNYQSDKHASSQIIFYGDGSETMLKPAGLASQCSYGYVKMEADEDTQSVDPLAIPDEVTPDIKTSTGDLCLSENLEICRSSTLCMEVDQKRIGIVHVEPRTLALDDHTTTTSNCEKRGNKIIESDNFKHLSNTRDKECTRTECKDTPEVTSNMEQCSSSVSGGKRYGCKECDYKSPFKSCVIRHLRTHVGDKPYKCNDCDYRTAWKSSLDVHIRTHTGDKPFKCNLCDYSAVKKSYLSIHMRIHTKDKPFKCSLCEYSGANKSNLYAHTRIHSADRPFKCNHCNYTTIWKSNLTNHLKSHTAEKPFKCSLCNYSSTRGSAISLHMKIHTEEKPFKCNL